MVAKIFTAFFLSPAIFLATSFGANPYCELFSDVGHYESLRRPRPAPRGNSEEFPVTLSRNWAQEQAGLTSAEQLGMSEAKRSEVLVIDGNEGDHALSVARIIDPGSHPNEPKHPNVRVSEVGDARDIGRELDKLLALPPELRPKIVNLSLTLRNDAHFKTHLLPKFSALEKAGVIFVTANGNLGEGAAGGLAEWSGGITVTSTAPFGPVKSDFAQVGKGTDVAAPSDRWLVGQRFGEPAVFGGTSGAAPLVTRALANVTAYLPDLSPAEAKHILWVCGGPPVRWLDGGVERSGPPTVNAFKMQIYARRLKAEGWPKNREALLARADLRDFSRLAQVKEEDGQAARDPSGAVTDSALNYYRQAFLLRPNPNLGETIARELDRRGLAIDAFYYRHQGETPHEVLRDLVTHEDPTLQNYGLAQAEDAANSLPYLEAFANNPHPGRAAGETFQILLGRELAMETFGGPAAVANGPFHRFVRRYADGPFHSPEMRRRWQTLNAQAGSPGAASPR